MCAMRWQISPSRLTGELTIPPSKSQTFRAIILALLARGKTTIKNALPSPDTDKLCHACTLLGAKITKKGDSIEVEGVGGTIVGAKDIIDVGNSGIALRFLGALAALGSAPIVFTGDASIRERRSCASLLKGLNDLGATAYALNNNDRAPFLVKGPLTGGTTEIEGVDSQPVSGLILASAFAKGKSTIHVKNPQETPYISLTLSWLDQLNLPYQARPFSCYTLFGNSAFEAFIYEVPADFSSLAFPVAAALVTPSKLTCKGLNFLDGQGDKEVINYFKAMGGDIVVDKLKGTLQIRGGKPLVGKTFHMADCIDAVPIMAVLGCFAKGETVLIGAEGAKYKESNRLKAITLELQKMGANICACPGGLRIKPHPLKGAKLQSHADHRIAMGLTVAALGASGNSEIEGGEWVEKTYPHFFATLKQLGANITCL